MGSTSFGAPPPLPPNFFKVKICNCLDCCYNYNDICKLNPLIKRLINLQKCLIRIVSRGPFDAHANPIFVSLRILKFGVTIKLQISKVVYLNKKGLLPNSFNDLFLLNCDVHSYRSKNSIHFFYCRTYVRKFSLCF